MLSLNLLGWSQSLLKDHHPAHTWNRSPKQRADKLQSQVLRLPFGQATKVLNQFTDGYPNPSCPRIQSPNQTRVLTFLKFLLILCLIDWIWHGKKCHVLMVKVNPVSKWTGFPKPTNPALVQEQSWRNIIRPRFGDNDGSKHQTGDISRLHFIPII